MSTKTILVTSVHAVKQQYIKSEEEMMKELEKEVANRRKQRIQESTALFRAQHEKDKMRRIWKKYGCQELLLWTQ